MSKSHPRSRNRRELAQAPVLPGTPLYRLLETVARHAAVRLAGTPPIPKRRPSKRVTAKARIERDDHAMTDDMTEEGIEPQAKSQ